MPASSSPWICSFARVRGVWVVVISFIIFFLGGGFCVRWAEDGLMDGLMDGWMEEVDGNLDGYANGQMDGWMVV